MTVQGGGRIRSAREYDEGQNKARAVLRASELAEKGL